MSATKTGTPAADSWPARSWSVFVLPVPVAPAMRPWRLIIDRATWTRVSLNSSPPCIGAADLEGRLAERVAGGHRVPERLVHPCLQVGASVERSRAGVGKRIIGRSRDM